MTTGKIHSIETFGTVDGPGIRYVVFFQGCPLRCKYCHNRDTWDISYGKTIQVEEIIKDVIKYSSYIKFSGGGITASGGEPTLQPSFLEELFKIAHEHNIHTCLDTSGFVDIDLIDSILEHTDLVLLDLKHMIDEKSIELTGVSIEKALRLAKYLNTKNIPIWIRHVLVPKLTDTYENLTKLRDFVSSLSNVEKVELLPYHSMGVYKWDKLEEVCPLKNTLDATSEDLKKAYSILKS